MYRLGYGVTVTVIEELFGVSESLAGITCMQVCKVMIAKHYHSSVKMPETEAEWVKEMKGFLRNYEFPTVGPWDWFHVYVSAKFNSYFSFKKCYKKGPILSSPWLGTTSWFYLAHLEYLEVLMTHDCFETPKYTKIFFLVVSFQTKEDRWGNLAIFRLSQEVTHHSLGIHGFNERTPDPMQRLFNK